MIKVQIKNLTSKTKEVKKKTQRVQIKNQLILRKLMKRKNKIYKIKSYINFLEMK